LLRATADGGFAGAAVIWRKVISTDDDESHPAFTLDGKTLYFLKNDPSFNHWTIVVSHQQNGKWSTPGVAPGTTPWNWTRRRKNNNAPISP
jgi:hypothetical protein